VEELLDEIAEQMWDQASADGDLGLDAGEDEGVRSTQQCPPSNCLICE